MEKITYQLPDSLIAQFPLEYRDHCKLMHLDAGTGEIKEHIFSDIVELLKPDDLLVINDTLVQRARLYGVGSQSGRRCEIFLIDKLSEQEWICLVRPGKKAKPGNRFYFTAKEYCEVAEVLPDGSRRISFIGSPPEVLMEKYGHVPLPPYIKRNDMSMDKIMYQAVYAKDGFSIAAPTAGLHFTDELLDRIEKSGVEIAAIRLDIGRGTFKPVTAKRYEKHKMDSEEFWISEEVAETINNAVAARRRIVAVGTTVVRTLEGCYAAHQTIKAGHEDTSIFIYPDFKFNVVNALLTNFHLPDSTLIALVAAFAGTETILKAYDFAIEKKWRFYSYGDAQFITSGGRVDE